MPSRGRAFQPGSRLPLVIGLVFVIALLKVIVETLFR
jgi:hypothetical protein